MTSSSFFKYLFEIQIHLNLQLSHFDLQLLVRQNLITSTQTFYLHWNFYYTYVKIIYLKFDKQKEFGFITHKLRMVYSLFSKEINGAHSSAQTSKIGPTKKGKPIFGSIIYNNSILTVESMPYAWVTRVTG